jgi:general secretion pathway protein A
MYLDFFGLKEPPFRLNPDPRFLYLSASHEEALRAIVYGVHQREGLLSLVGEAGTGKTIMLRTAMEWLGPKTRVAFISNFQLNFDDLLRLILSELGVKKGKGRLSKVKCLQQLRQFAEAQSAGGGNVVLMVDEAQHLSVGDLANLRLLTNLETPTRKLLQVVLSGQHELERKLGLPELKHLSDRLAQRYRIRPLKETEVYAYIGRRLKVGGFKGASPFTRDSLRMISDFSHGIPRKINELCDKAMVEAYEIRSRIVMESLVEKAHKGLQSGAGGSESDSRPKSRFAGGINQKVIM